MNKRAAAVAVTLCLTTLAAAYLRFVAPDVARAGAALSKPAASTSIPASDPAINPMGTAPVIAAATVPRPRIVVVKRDWAPLKRYSTVTAALSDLQAAAEAGEVDAMLGNARALQVCRLGWNDARAVQALEREVLDTGDELSDGLEAQVAAQTAYCDLSNTQVTGLYRRWLLQAADSGDAQSQLYAALYPPLPTDLLSWELSYRRQGRDSPDIRVGEAHALSLKYAHLAREQGEVDAAFVLAMSAENLDGADDDPAERFENAWLADAIGQSEGRPSWGLGLKSRGDPLLPVQRAEAEAAARAVLERIPVWTRRPMRLPEQSVGATAAANPLSSADTDSTSDPAATPR